MGYIPKAEFNLRADYSNIFDDQELLQVGPEITYQDDSSALASFVIAEGNTRFERMAGILKMSTKQLAGAEVRWLTEQRFLEPGKDLLARNRPEREMVLVKLESGERRIIFVEQGQNPNAYKAEEIYSPLTEKDEIRIYKGGLVERKFTLYDDVEAWEILELNQGESKFVGFRLDKEKQNGSAPYYDKSRHDTSWEPKLAELRIGDEAFVVTSDYHLVKYTGFTEGGAKVQILGRSNVKEVQIAGQVLKLETNADLPTIFVCKDLVGAVTWVTTTRDEKNVGQISLVMGESESIMSLATALDPEKFFGIYGSERARPLAKLVTDTRKIDESLRQHELSFDDWQPMGIVMLTFSIGIENYNQWPWVVVLRKNDGKLKFAELPSIANIVNNSARPDIIPDYNKYHRS